MSDMAEKKKAVKKAAADSRLKKKPRKKKRRKRPSQKRLLNGKKPERKEGRGKPKKGIAISDNGNEREEAKTYGERREEERTKRHAARRRKVRRQKIALVALSAVIVLCIAVGAVLVNNPSMRYSWYLSRGDKYTQEGEYEKAQASYEAALAIDDKSVKAYRSIAENYLAQKENEAAKQVFYKGWEKTQDSSLLNYYCTVILNEATGEINSRNVTLATIDKIIQVLEKDAKNEEALSRLRTCHERLFESVWEGEYCTLFYDADVTVDGCKYSEYEKLIRRMLKVYEAAPSDGLKELLSAYVLIDTEPVRISMTHLEDYKALLTDIHAATADDGIDEALACLADAEEMEAYFSQAFTEFSAGNYEYARQIVSDEKYQAIRDSFIRENNTYWEGSVYIPINQEQIVLWKKDGHYKYYFLDYEEYENSKGVITVWGSKQEDDGVQRSVISYTPARQGGEESPGTEYTIQYLYSNVKVKGAYVPQMNYRLDVKVKTEEGTSTTTIGDWGGEHEYEIAY